MSNLEKAELIVNRSGNNFHSKVTNYLIEKEWDVLVSPYYMDNASNKPREIDLVAEYAWPYTDHFKDKHGTVNIKLFIECKYIPQISVFWFANKDIASAKNWVSKNTPIEDYDFVSGRHHYLSTNPKVAKLFSSENKQNVENEVIYKALNQSLNAMVYLRNKKSIITPKSHQNNNILAAVELPIIVCDSFDNFYRVDMLDPGKPEKISDNFQLEVNYAYIDYQGSQRSEYFLLDIVNFNNIDKFIDILEFDKNLIFQNI